MFDDHLSRWERIFYSAILILALFTRFYILGERAISHDESIHTKFAWNLFAGQGFQHNPMMHGPLLFEATALSYFMFGPNDFTSRIYTALAGVALVMTPLLFRKWLGKRGAAATALMLLLSPTISYYSRYIRHDAPMMLFAILWIWTIVKYLDTAKPKWLYWMAAYFSLMHATKEVNYIYIAIIGGLLFFPFAWQVFTIHWKRTQLFTVFTFVLIGALLLAGVFAMSFLSANVASQNLDEAGNTQVVDVTLPSWGRIAAALAFIALFTALILVYYGVGPEQMHEMRLFDVLMSTGTLTLPLGSAFLINFVAGVDMGIVYEAVRTGSFTNLPASTVWGIFIVVAIALSASVALGLWWNKKHWPFIALIHYTIFFVTYTSIFTWGFGSLSGLVGSLAYWMAQHGVERGGQSWYYYFVIGPLYEYLPLFFTLPASIGAILYAWKNKAPSPTLDIETLATPPSPNLKSLFPLFLCGWTLLSWLGYTYAGEKMPWLIVHIALPSIFLAGWGSGWLLDSLDLRPASADDKPIRNIALFIIALPLTLTAVVTLTSAGREWRGAMATGISTAGPTLAQLYPLGQTLGAVLSTIVFGGGLLWLGQKLTWKRTWRLSALTLTAALTLLTTRTMAHANFINYDSAVEYLVYAHGAPGIKIALQQVQDISWKATSSQYDVKVAYGEDGSWPLTWYMVDYPNNYFYSTTPDRDTLLDCPVVIAGSPQYAAVEEILSTDYLYFDYKYLWWPVEDYKGMTIERIRNAIRDPAMRAALWDIIWDRDYARYAAIKNPNAPFTLQTWPYRKEFRLYVRQDLAHEVWSYRLSEMAPQDIKPQATPIPDPYRAGERTLPTAHQATLANSSPRGMTLAPDDTLYLADTQQHRVWHITADGAVLGMLGEFGAEPGQFNEPWDVTLDADGNLYIADTWNHRIQKFDADGHYITHWGVWAQLPAFDPAGQGAFFGPRGIVVSQAGEVFVTDTGNKRVQVFDTNGTFLREFGGAGRGVGQMNEPVGIALSPDEQELLVADSWNGRVQVFTPQGDFLRQWQVPTWSLDHPEEKPYLAVDADTIYLTDPTHKRVLAFTHTGDFRWAVTGSDTNTLTYPTGVLVAIGTGTLFVSDPHVMQIVGFKLP